MGVSVIEVNILKRAPGIDGMMSEVLNRWSPRAFTDRAVSPADLRRVFEAARWAPSSGNEQPWRYLVGLRNSSTHSKISETFAGYNRNWAPQAPVLILGTTNTKLSRHDAANIYAMYDLGAATAMLVLQATALGLATHQMGGFDHDAIREALQIPEEYALGSVMALGYQAEPAALADEELIKREMAPRSRKPVTEIAFSAWHEPAELE